MCAGVFDSMVCSGAIPEKGFFESVCSLTSFFMFQDSFTVRFCSAVFCVVASGAQEQLQQQQLVSNTCDPHPV